MSDMGLSNLNQFREIPSSTTIAPPGNLTGMGLGSGLSWLVSEGTGMLQSMGSSGLEMTKQVLSDGLTMGGGIVEGVKIGTGAIGSFVVAHPVVTTVGVPLVIGGTAMGVGYIQGWSSGTTVKAPSTDEQQRVAQDRVDTLRMTNSERGTMDSLRGFLNEDHVVMNDEALEGTLTLGDGKTIDGEIEGKLSSYALRGAHIVVDGDKGELFVDMLKDLGVLDKNTNYTVDEALEHVGQDLPKGMIERNTSRFNGSSHYATGNPGNFDGLRQFGVDLAGGGHLLFGVRSGDGGETHESWFQFEGHGVSSWTDFGGHALDFARHKGSGNGQVGPLGYCPFSEKNGTEIRLGTFHDLD